MTTVIDPERWPRLEDRLKNSRWGYVQHKTEIEEGLFAVSTSTHGGLVMDVDHYMKLPEELRPYVAAGGYAEEDCHMGIVLLLLGRTLPFMGRDAVVENVKTSLKVLESLVEVYGMEHYTVQFDLVKKHVQPILCGRADSA